MCYNSFIAGGQKVDLYTYDAIDVPEGVQLRCADEVISRDAIFRTLDSWSPFSNLFRYSLLHKLGGWWIDSDVYYNHKIIPKADFIFAEQEKGVVNTGQLKFPKGHPVLFDAIGRFQKFDTAKIRWSETGPLLLTATLRDHRLDKKGVPTETLYPIHWLETYKFWFPEFAYYIEHRTRRSPFIHLWTSRFARFGIDVDRERPLPFSFMDKIYRRAGVYEKYQLFIQDVEHIKRKTNKYLNSWGHYREAPYSLDLPPP